MQVIAILRDSLHELRSRSLFWVALVISVVVPFLLFGLIGFNQDGWRVVWFETNLSEVLRSGSAGARDLVSWLFGGALMWWWLTWGAIVVALITTSSTIPEFVASGGIDLVLSKPIGRFKLLSVKILAATLFVLLQVLVCVSISYLLAGLRFGLWFHAAWLAAPLVMLQFLYLFSFMTLVGIVTRSALASLLATLIFWATVSLVQFSSNQLDSSVAESEAAIADAAARIARIRDEAQREGRELTTPESARIGEIERRTEPMRRLQASLSPWRGPLRTIELFVPKTGDVQKIIANTMDAPTFEELIIRLQGFDPEAMAGLAGMSDGEQFRSAQRAGAAGSRAARQVDPLISIGSSLVFTVTLLGVSAIIFARRDF